MRYLLGIICSLASAFVCAESHQGSDASEAILTAIKERFVAQAQDADTQVTNTAWLDSDGRLHESTMIRSDVRVRGVQVRSYLEEMRRPEVEVALDDQIRCVTAMFYQRRSSHPNRLKCIQHCSRVNLMSIMQASFVSWARLVTREFNQGLERSPFWHTLALTQPSSGYLQMVSGIRSELSRYEMQIALSPEFCT
jgi:hypothetical protein